MDGGHAADAVLLLELAQLYHDGSPALTTQMVVDMLRMVLDAVRVQGQDFWDAHFSAVGGGVEGRVPDVLHAVPGAVHQSCVGGRLC